MPQTLLASDEHGMTLYFKNLTLNSFLIQVRRLLEFMLQIVHFLMKSCIFLSSSTMSLLIFFSYSFKSSMSSKFTCLLLLVWSRGVETSSLTLCASPNILTSSSICFTLLSSSWLIALSSAVMHCETLLLIFKLSVYLFFVLKVLLLVTPGMYGVCDLDCSAE